MFTTYILTKNSTNIFINLFFIMKKFLLFGTILFLNLAAVSCHDDDDRKPVLPPVVEAAPNTLSGVVTDMSGNPVVGATVSAGEYTAVTDANGAYSISGIAQGDYNFTAKAENMLDAATSVVFTQANSQNRLWSVAMNRKVTQNLEVKNPNVDATGDVQSENIPGNEEGAVDIKVDVPANTVPANTTINITPIYSENAAGSRASEVETMLIGANVTCSDPNLTLSTPINVTFALDASVASAVVVKEYDNATKTWNRINPTINPNGIIVISTTKFTMFGIFLPVSVATTASSEEISFAQSVYDNRKGAGNMLVESAPFTYKAGTQIQSTATNKLEGLLIEHLARQYGAKVTTVQGNYPLNVNLAIGQGVRLSGTQSTTALKVSSGNASVNGTAYGNYNVTVTPFSVDHNGGAGGVD